MAYVTDKDKAEFLRASQLVNDGRALRKRVLGRIRQRAYRERQEALQ